MSVVSPAGIGPARPAVSLPLAAVTLALLLGLQPVTTDMYLPAFPLLTRELGAGMAQAQLTMSALILAFGVAQLVWGPLADRLGRRPVLLLGLALYALASAGCVLAGSIEALVVWRALQGAAMAAAVVCARAIVRDLYEPVQGAQVMSLALTGLGVIALASPLLGGVMANAVGWRGVLALVGGGGNGAGCSIREVSGVAGWPRAAKLALVSRNACSRPSVAPSASDLRQAGVSNSAAKAKLAAPMGPR